MDAQELRRQAGIFNLPFTLEQLRLLKAIAATGSFSKAAESLYVSQPAVSLQIQNLERQLNTPLFVRVGRRSQLTEAGHLLLSYGERILALCQETCSALEDLENLQGGILSLGASQTPGTYFMPKLIAQFRQQYPKIAVQLHVRSTHQIGWSVVNGHIDLALIEGEIASELLEFLEIIPYVEDEISLILPVSHPLAQRGIVQKEDLYQLQLIALDSQSTTRKVIDRILVREGIETQRLNIEMEFSSLEAIKNSVQAGLGAAFVSTSAIEKELQLGILRQVKVENLTFKRSISVIFSLNHYRSKAAETFRREILPQFTSWETAKTGLNP
jgi:DNA-binding transcriptional LysR family regulator